jgi:RHS repeat-associated protein
MAYSYGPGGLTAITDANGYVTSYSYDSRRRLTATTWPDGTQETSTYWDDALLRSRTDQRSVTQSYAYDRHKRLQTLQLPAGAISYEYTGQKLVEIVDSTVVPIETHLIGYDSLYRPNLETQGPRGTVTRVYNADDTTQSMAIQGGPTTTYTYYPDRSLSTISWSPVGGVFKYFYNLRGLTTSLVMPNNQRRELAYDDQGRLLQVANKAPNGSNLATYSYAYDQNHASGAWDRLGQRIAMTATVPSQSLNAHLTKYEYDPRYRLTKTTYPNVAPFNGEVHSWAYDSIGNRVASTVNGVSVGYSYQKLGANPANWQRLLSDGVNSYTYYANGSTATRNGSGGSIAFGVDARGRTSGLTGSTTASYLYDYKGRRVAKTVGAASTYLYDELALVQSSAGSAADYVFGPGIDEPLAVRAGQVYYFVTDGMGSVSLLTNSAGSVQNKYVYDAWGVVRSQTTAIPNVFGYTGREFGEAGLWYFRARYQQPSIGRFLGEDPLRFSSGDPSFYGYAMGNPVTFTDPLGLGVWEWICDFFRRAPKDPFRGCDGTCEDPCRDWSKSCTGKCGSMQKCVVCCDKWRQKAERAPGCGVRCRADNARYYTVCALSFCGGDI